jgi:hypothetical protein
MEIGLIGGREDPRGRAAGGWSTARRLALMVIGTLHFIRDDGRGLTRLVAGGVHPAVVPRPRLPDYL